MKRSVLFLFAAIAALAFPAVASAQTDNKDDFLFRAGGTAIVGPGERAGTVIMINGDVVIDGTVTGTVLVVNGDATVSGWIQQDIVVIRGDLNLLAGARVKNVTLVASDLNREQSATISGEISQRSEVINFGWGSAIFSFGFWIGATIAVLVFGLIFAAAAGPHLIHAATELASEPVKSLIAAILVWIAFPIAAVLTILTVIGIPLGLAILLSLPILWLLGYAVAGALLGRIILHRTSWTEHSRHPYWSTLLGLMLFQLVGLAPFLGGVVVGIAGFIGSGALVLLMKKSRRHPESAAPGASESAAPAV